MLKLYKAKSQVSLSVPLQNGGTARVSFEARTNAGSFYYTSNEAVQWGLEHHPKYGRLFRLDSVIQPQQQQPEQVEVSKVEVKDEGVSMEFLTNNDAKDYLSDKYGVSRTKLLSRKAIEEYAAGKGITITWSK